MLRTALARRGEAMRGDLVEPVGRSTLMLNGIRWFSLSMLCLLTAACATAPPMPADVSARPFVLERDLVGRSTARGEFRSITGARRGFDAQLEGAWDGRTLTLVEDFAFDDGERDRKTWRLERIAPGRYVGVREDVVGRARGFQDGRAFRLEYDVLLRTEGGVRRVRFRDVLVLAANDTVRNDAVVGWFGLRVGSVSLTIRRDVAPVGALSEPTNADATP